jgi:putative flippase GtrA
LTRSPGLIARRFPAIHVRSRAYPTIERSGRYLAVSVICALTNNAVLILGDLAGGHYVPLTFACFAITTPLGYILHARFTFRDSYSWRAFARFASGAATGFPISFVAIAILCSGFGLPVMIAAPVATIALFLWNYACAHWAIRGNRHCS